MVYSGFPPLAGIMRIIHVLCRVECNSSVSVPGTLLKKKNSGDPEAPEHGPRVGVAPEVVVTRGAGSGKRIPDCRGAGDDLPPEQVCGPRAVGIKSEVVGDTGVLVLEVDGHVRTGGDGYDRCVEGEVLRDKPDGYRTRRG